MILLDNEVADELDDITVENRAIVLSMIKGYWPNWAGVTRIADQYM